MIEFGVTLRVQSSERKIFQLLLDVLHAQSISQWGIDIESFLSRTLLFLDGHTCKCSHVVQSVGELDHENAHVACHCDQHLAHGGGLLGFTGIKLQAL